jgi:hypothetical protein
MLIEYHKTRWSVSTMKNNLQENNEWSTLEDFNVDLSFHNLKYKYKYKYYNLHFYNYIYEFIPP